MSHSLRSRSTKAPEAPPPPAVTSPATPSKKADNFPLPPSPALASRPQRNRNLPKGYSNFVMPPIAKPNGVHETNGNGNANATDESSVAPTRQSSGSSSPSSSPKQAPARLSPQLLSASTPALTPLLSALIGSPSLPPASLSSFPSPLVSTKDGGDLQLSPALRSSAGFLKSPALSALASFRSSLPRRDSTNSVSGYLNLDKDKKGGDNDPSTLKGSPVLASFQALSSPAIMSKKGLAAMSPLLPPLGSDGSKGEPRVLNFSKKGDSKADGTNGGHTNGTSLYSPAFPSASYPSPGFSALLRSPNVSPTLPPFPSPGIPALGPLCSPVLRSALSSSPLGLMPLSALNSSSSPLLGSSNGLSLSSPLLSSLWHSNNALTLSPLLSSIAGGHGPASHGAADAVGRKRRAQSDADESENKDEHADKKQALTDLRWTDPSGVTSLSFRRNRSANSLNSEHDGSKPGSQEHAEDEEGDAEMGSDEGENGEHIKDNMDPMVTNGLLHDHHDHEAVNSLSSLAALVSTKHMSSSASSDSVKVEPSANMAPNPKPSAESATQSVSVSGTGLTGPSAANGANTAPTTPREPLNTANLPGINLPAYKPHNGFPLDSDVLLASIAAVLSGKTKELSNINRMLPLHHYRPCMAQTPAHLKKGIAAKPELEAPADMAGGNDSLDLGDGDDPLSDGEYDVKGLTPKAGNGSGSSCHQCKSRRHMSHLIFCCNMFAKRNGKGKRRICRKKYCWQCLQKFYQEQPPKKRQDPSSTWQCPSCRSICCCALCRRVRQEKTDHQNVDPAMSLAFGFVYFNKIDQLGHDSKFRLDVLWRKWLSLSPAATNEIADLGDLSEIEIQQPADGSPAQSPSHGGPGLSSIKLPSNLGGVKLEMRS